MDGVELMSCRLKAGGLSIGEVSVEDTKRLVVGGRAEGVAVGVTCCSCGKAWDCSSKGKGVYVVCRPSVRPDLAPPATSRLSVAQGPVQRIQQVPRRCVTSQRVGIVTAAGWGGMGQGLTLKYCAGQTDNYAL